MVKKRYIWEKFSQNLKLIFNVREALTLNIVRGTTDLEMESTASRVHSVATSFTNCNATITKAYLKIENWEPKTKDWRRPHTFWAWLWPPFEASKIEKNLHQPLDSWTQLMPACLLPFLFLFLLLISGIKEPIHLLPSGSIGGSSTRLCCIIFNLHFSQLIQKAPHQIWKQCKWLNF